MADQKIVYETDTAYGHYQVVDGPYDGRQARVLYSGIRQAAQSGLALDGKPDLLFDYNQRFLELVRGLEPDAMLVIGGGACTLPRAVMLEFPGITVDVVELDADLIHIARKFFDFQPTVKSRVLVGDGRQFIASTKQRYDLIILDAFVQTDIPQTFRTVDAIRDFYACLSPKGVLAINIIAVYNGIRSAPLHTLAADLRSCFEQVSLTPADSRDSLWIAQNFVVTAEKTMVNASDFMRNRPLDI